MMVPSPIMSEGVQVVDLSTRAAPVLVASFKTRAPARDVTASTSVDEDGEVLVLSRGAAK